jgi:UPF0042 nucleotide-binding protein
VKPSIVIVTGLSGSGKTVALRALEDIGFSCTDNIPPELIDKFASLTIERGRRRMIAVGIDIREKEFLSSIDSVLLGLREKYHIEIIFLDAETDVIVRRFKETRRPHPLSLTGEGDIEKSITLEKKLLEPLMAFSDRIIDTSSYTPHQLRRIISSLYSGAPDADAMRLTLISFGYKFGIPQSIDLLFDVRFIPNPFFISELKELKGTDDAVRRFVLEKGETGEFMERLKGLLDYLIPLYIKEGKTYLTVGIGCTGGRHRSPVIANEIAQLLKGHPVKISIVHRDM